MNTVEVKLLKYKFTFRQLAWREEHAIKFEGKDARRVLLSSALHEISGLAVTSYKEAYRVIEALPVPILNRVFVMYKGGLPNSREFTTLNLYQAPSPRSYQEQLSREEAAKTLKVESKLDEVEANILKEARDGKGGFKGAVKLEEKTLA
jgi:hypothetical protein